MSQNFDSLASQIQESVHKICLGNGVDPVLFQIVILDANHKTFSMGNTAGNEGVAIKILADAIGDLGSRVAQDTAERAQIMGNLLPKSGAN